MTELHLTVAILTYRRPGMLGRGLPLVLDQVQSITADVGAPIRADVLVVDNDPVGSAKEVARAFADSGVRYIVEPTPGIAAARNRALDGARDADLLVFLDDDEQPRAAWLARLVTTYYETRPAAVMGRVVSQFDTALDPWVAAGDFFERPRLATGTEIEVAATGNLLLDLRQVRALGVRFRNSLGLSGGEDSLFSRELVKAGARLVWCDESVADDYVEADRLTRRWLLGRASSQGNTRSRVEIYLASGLLERFGARVRMISSGFIRLACGTARYLVGLAVGSYRHQARGLRTARRGWGMISGAAGVVYQEYARDSRRLTVLRRSPRRGRARDQSGPRYGRTD